MPDDGDRYELMTMIAPFAVQTAFDSAVQPDVLVTRYVDLTPKHLPVRVAPARLLDGLRP